VNGKSERAGAVPLWIGANDPFGVSLVRCGTRTLQASTPERGDARA
jgi:hypothetical protein